MRRSSRARSGPTTDWFPDLDGWFRPFDPRFEVGARFRDTQRNARQYLAGLLLPGSRKSMDPIGNRIPEADGDRLQNFLTDSPWNAEEVQQQLAGQIAERFGVPHAVLALYDTTFPKQGSASVGVAHQWCGALGKTANCQSGVTLYYVLPFDRESREMVGFTVGARLYLPKKWIDDGPRRTKARVPPSVGYEDKPQIGLELIDRARAAGLPHRAVLADAEYGRSGEFRRALRERGESYVVGIQPHSTVVARAGEGPIRVDRLIPTVSAAEWRSVVWARGTKGPMTVELVRYPVTVWHEGKATEEEGILLLERRSNETKASRVGDGSAVPDGDGAADALAVADRAGLSTDEAGARAGPLRGADLDRLAPSHDDGCDGSGVPRLAQGRSRGKGRPTAERGTGGRGDPRTGSPTDPSAGRSGHGPKSPGRADESALGIARCAAGDTGRSNHHRRLAVPATGSAAPVRAKR
jgi:hypothetical protein